MNLFNQISSRKLGWGETTIFANFLNNMLFIFVLGGEFVLQWVIVEFLPLHMFFRTESLTTYMHITCYSFGVGALIVNYAAKKIFADKNKFEKLFEFDFNETNDKARYFKVLQIADNIAQSANAKTPLIEKETHFD